MQQRGEEISGESEAPDASRGGGETEKEEGKGENPDILRVAGILVLKFRSRLLCPPPPLSLFLFWLVDEREECQKKTRSFLFYSPRHTHMEKTGQEQKIPAKCLGLLKDIFWREREKKKKKSSHG